MLAILCPLLIPVSLVLLFRFVNNSNKRPIFGVYQRNNKYYWVKFLFLYTILKFKQLKNHLTQLYAVEVGKSSDGTLHVYERDAALENKYNLGSSPQAVDAVYFNGTDGNNAVICNIARRSKNIDSFVYIKLDGEELLLSPELPDTYHIESDNEENSYEVAGLKLWNFTPMRSWKVQYNGEMKSKNATDKRFKVEMDLNWGAVFAPFNYDTQMSPRSMACDIAKESWSRNYFIVLESLHQTHYEQMGFLEGTIKVDGKENFIHIPCVRDHTFGPFRDWRTFHRYVIHFIFLENGDCMAVGTVCQPSAVSDLTIGYICLKSDQSTHPVDSCDFELYQHGENQVLPKDYAFSFKAGGETYTVKVLVDDEESFYIGNNGNNRATKVYERWSSVTVNGIKGSACLEWLYNISD